MLRELFHFSALSFAILPLAFTWNFFLFTPSFLYCVDQSFVCVSDIDISLLTAPFTHFRGCFTASVRLLESNASLRC